MLLIMKKNSTIDVKSANKVGTLVHIVHTIFKN